VALLPHVLIGMALIDALIRLGASQLTPLFLVIKRDFWRPGQVLARGVRCQVARFA